MPSSRDSQTVSQDPKVSHMCCQAILEGEEGQDELEELMTGLSLPIRSVQNGDEIQPVTQ